MSIYEYDAERQRIFDREEGRELGLEQGRSEGEWLKLISQIYKKLSKNLDTATIAEHIEEPIETVTAIVHLVQEHKTATAEEIYQLYEKELQ